MDPQTLIFDISSDEEIGFDNSSSADNFDWVSKLLEDDDDVGGVFPGVNNLQNPSCDAINQNSTGSDGSTVTNNINSNDDDDVVVVGEVIVKPRRANRSIHTPVAGGDDDDDCVVLECDPDKPPAAADVAANDDGLKNGEDDDGDEDDLVVVGEKGQVACRDFPHSRHLCANLPFSCTPHESRCEQCHCYVCDSLAPCAYWGTGALSGDHCNATDKVEFWQLERKRFRQLQNPSLATTDHISPQPQPQPPQYVHSSGQPSVLPRMATSCAVSSPYSVQRMISRRNQMERQLYQSQLVSRQLSRAYKGNVLSNRVVHPAARMVPSHAVFKRSGCSRRPVVVNRSPYNSPDNVSVAYVQPQDQQLAGKPSVNPRDPRLVINLRSCQSNTSSISPRTLPVPLRGHGLSSPQTPTSRFHGFGQSAAATSDQPRMYASVYQTQNIASPIIPDNTSSALNSFSQISQQHSSVTQCAPAQNVACPVSDVLTSVSQSVHQPLALPQTYYNPLEPCSGTNVVNVLQTCQPPFTENPVIEQSVPVLEHVPSAELDSSDFDFDSWLDDFEPQALFSDMNSQASGTAPLDPGMLCFDFETSWKGVTNGT